MKSTFRISKVVIVAMAFFILLFGTAPSREDNLDVKGSGEMTAHELDVFIAEEQHKYQHRDDLESNSEPSVRVDIQSVSVRTESSDHIVGDDVDDNEQETTLPVNSETIESDGNLE